uniref:Gem-associated protein 7 n=1 Tax=Amblyomma cajennense TaxID=34607 RepID=A0A023FN33_AMBCJ
MRVSEMPPLGEESCESPPKEGDELLARQQEARAFLRQQFLLCMRGLVGHVATFHMHEKTTVTATFRSCDMDVQNFGVSELSTALGIQPAALLRTGDVIRFSVNDLAATTGLRRPAATTDLATTTDSSVDS